MLFCSRIGVGCGDGNRFIVWLVGLVVMHTFLYYFLLSLYRSFVAARLIQCVHLLRCLLVPKMSLNRVAHALVGVFVSAATTSRADNDVVKSNIVGGR